MLANVALHGMEEELGVKYHLDRGNHKLARNSVGIVKYADDCAPRKRGRQLVRVA